MIWLAPWAAIAWTERTGYVRWLLASLMLVGGLMLLASSALADVALWSVKALVLLRNLLLVAVPVVYLLERTGAPRASSTASAPTDVGTRLKIRPSASS
jgi:hypothetical protein